MAGATAATAAGVTASQASTITLNLVGNYISGSGGNHLNADLTGDGQPDLAIAGAFTISVVALHSQRTPPPIGPASTSMAFLPPPFIAGTILWDRCD